MASWTVAFLAATAALAVGQDVSIVRYPFAAPLRQPPVQQSQAGVLCTELRATEARYNNGKVAFTTRTYEGLITGPTLRVRRGDKVQVRLINNLQNTCGPGTECGTHCSTRHNVFKCPTTTNLHMHGLHVPGMGLGDNVLRAAQPGESLQYEYTIPMDHPPGTHWYHPHFHGATALQVGQGMAGALIVEDDPSQLGYSQQLAAMGDTVAVLQQFVLANSTDQRFNPETAADLAAAIDQLADLPPCRDGYSAQGTVCVANCPPGTVPAFGSKCAKTTQPRGPFRLQTMQTPTGGCDAGFNNVLGTCWPSCPSGYADIGAACTRPTYSRVRVPSGCVTTLFCGAGCGANSTKNLLGYCEDQCRPGFDAMGGRCYGRCPSAGFILSGLLTCVKQPYVAVLGKLGCSAGLEQVGPLCYPPCPAGTVTEGLVCKTTCGPETVDDGAFCVPKRYELSSGVAVDTDKRPQFLQTLLASADRTGNSIVRTAELLRQMLSDPIREMGAAISYVGSLLNATPEELAGIQDPQQLALAVTMRAQQVSFALPELQRIARDPLAMAITASDRRYLSTAGFLTVNGQLQPRVALRPGELRRLRLVAAYAETYLELGVDGDLCELHLLAMDGAYRRAPKKVQVIVLGSGGRADVAVVCRQPGQFRLTSWKGHGGADMARAREQTVLGGNQPARDRWQGLVMVFNVTGEAVSMQLPTTLPALPTYMKDLTATDINSQAQCRDGSCRFNIHPDLGEKWNNMKFPHNAVEHKQGSVVDRSGYATVMKADTVQEWITLGRPTHPHSLHVHGTHFQLVGCSAGCERTGAHEIGEWRDTLPLLAGEYRVRFMTHNGMRGTIMVHCHVLQHEDKGMMLLADVLASNGAQVQANWTLAYPNLCPSRAPR